MEGVWRIVVGIGTGGLFVGDGAAGARARGEAADMGDEVFDSDIVELCKGYSYSVGREQFSAFLKAISPSRRHHSEVLPRCSKPTSLV